MVYVTHDQTEAMTLGDRVAVMRAGIIQQVDTPSNLYEEPVNLFVAGFIGSPPMNFIPGRISAGLIETPFGTVPAASDRHRAVGDRGLVIIGLRPEYFEDSALLSPERRGRGITFRAEVDVTEWLGNQLYAYVPYEAPPEINRQLQELERELDSEQMRTQLVIALDPASRIRSGTSAELWFDPERMHIFDASSGENLTRDPNRVFEDDRPHAAQSAVPTQREETTLPG
jgi:multiple sugar transport system ATP-binding protein